MLSVKLDNGDVVRFKLCTGTEILEKKGAFVVFWVDSGTRRLTVFNWSHVIGYAFDDTTFPNSKEDSRKRHEKNEKG